MIEVLGKPIVTYYSFMVGTWVAYIDLGHDYLGVRFKGETEQEAIDNATKFWIDTEAKRAETIANIEAGRLKRVKKVVTT